VSGTYRTRAVSTRSPAPEEQPTHPMDLKIISRLVRIMQRGDVNELELDDSEHGYRVRLKRGTLEPAGSGAQPVVHVLQGGGLPAPAAAPGAPAPAAAPEGTAGESTPPGTKPFPSPMVGTFYRSPSPDADPFVSAGSTIEPETVVCIIEAMKVMNEVKAEMSGEVVEVLVENGEPVEYGQPLFLVKPA